MRGFLERNELSAVDEVLDGIWEETQGIVKTCKVQDRPIRRVRRVAQKAPGNFDGEEDNRGRVFIRVCKKVLDEHDRQFLNAENKVMYSGVVALTLGTVNFADREAVIAFCRHYGIIEDNTAASGRA